jgi:hypothetical protein
MILRHSTSTMDNKPRRKPVCIIFSTRLHSVGRLSTPDCTHNQSGNHSLITITLLHPPWGWGHLLQLSPCATTMAPPRPWRPSLELLDWASECTSCSSWAGATTSRWVSSPGKLVPAFGESRPQASAPASFR